MTRTEFLLARIAEDEETARAADGTRWLHEDKVVSFEAFGPDGDWVDASSPLSVNTRDNGWHIVNWSPARVLAECEAKRRIVDNPPADWDAHVQWEETVDILAAVYADHPDYRQEWRP